MKEGSKWELFVPPKLGYGERSVRSDSTKQHAHFRGGTGRGEVIEWE